MTEDEAPTADPFVELLFSKPFAVASNPEVGEQGAASGVVGIGGPIIGHPQAWVAKALDAELDTLADTPEGGRNHALNRAAFLVATWHAGGLPIDLEGARSLLTEAAQQTGLGLSEINAAITSGFTGGARKPFAWQRDPLSGPGRLVPTTTGTGSTTDPWTPSASSATADPADIAAFFAQAVEREVWEQKVKEAARLQVAADRAAADFIMPVAKTLTEILAEKDEEEKWLIDTVLPFGGNATLTAPFKTGKTTLMANLLRTLADQEFFLGRYSVPCPIQDIGRIALWDYEMSPRALRDWLRKQGIHNTDAISVLYLRGKRIPLTTPHGQQEAINWLKDNGIGVWIIDPFARAAVGCGLDENSNTDVSLFTDTIDVIKHEAGVHSFVMPVHTGRAEFEIGKERARGATRLDDWPDARWLLARDGDQRFFRADGRDVKVDETGLKYDETTRAYEATGGSRQHTKEIGTDQEILDVISRQPGIKWSDLIGGEVPDSKANRAALKRLEKSPALRVEEKGNSKFYTAVRETVIRPVFDEP